MTRQAVRAGAPAGLGLLTVLLTVPLTALLVAACSTGVAPATSAAGASSPGAAAPSTSPGGSAPAGSSGSSGSSAATLPSPAVRQITLTVAGASVTGDTGLVALRVGEPAQVTVTSDVADEVHVHGSGGGVGGQVPAGGTVTIPFTETAPGRYEIELERAKRTLTRLQVR